jgi:hypothetical protein
MSTSKFTGARNWSEWSPSAARARNRPEWLPLGAKSVPHRSGTKAERGRRRAMMWWWWWVLGRLGTVRRPQRTWQRVGLHAGKCANCSERVIVPPRIDGELKSYQQQRDAARRPSPTTVSRRRPRRASVLPRHRSESTTSASAPVAHHRLLSSGRNYGESIHGPSGVRLPVDAPERYRAQGSSHSNGSIRGGRIADMVSEQDLRRIAAFVDDSRDGWPGPSGISPDRAVTRAPPAVVEADD